MKLTGNNVAYACVMLASGAFFASTNVPAQVLAMTTEPNAASIGRQVTFGSGGAPGAIEEAALRSRLHRQIVYHSTSEAPGSIVVDTPNTFLYFVLDGGKAIRYGIGVGRDGFTWALELAPL
jgi:lipoprotein-anchoring transpeptidase ErfK/SrfK